jgi:large subunit ribosomal protein L6
MCVRKYAIKIPSNIIVLYCCKKKIIVLIKKEEKKLLKLAVKILIDNNSRQIFVTRVSNSRISKNKIKKLSALQGTTTALIKQNLVEISATFYKKLRFVGVGYRATPVPKLDNKNLLLIRLGLSHPLYFNIINKPVKIFCLKLTRLFIYGNSYQSVNQAAARVRLYKTPEPYKGKGILYNTEKIKLKVGKRV